MLAGITTPTGKIFLNMLHFDLWEEPLMYFFWGLTGSYGGNYGPPSDYNFDVNNNDPTPVMDDTWLHDYNVPDRVEGPVAVTPTS